MKNASKRNSCKMNVYNFSMRIVDVLDEINNNGKPMEEYFFWPDVQVLKI